MNENVWPLILLGGGLLAFLLVVSFLSKNYSLNNFKNKTVGDGQHGELRQVFALLERNRIGHDHFRQRAFVDAVGTGHRPRQYGRQKAQR